MMNNKYFIIFIIGGLTFCLLDYLSNLNDSKYTSILAAFPLLFLVGLCFIKLKNKNTECYILSSCKSIFIYLLFLLLLLLLLHKKYNLYKSILISFIFWIFLIYFFV